MGSFPPPSWQSRLVLHCGLLSFFFPSTTFVCVHFPLYPLPSSSRLHHLRSFKYIVPSYRHKKAQWILGRRQKKLSFGLPLKLLIFHWCSNRKYVMLWTQRERKRERWNDQFSVIGQTKMRDRFFFLLPRLQQFPRREKGLAIYFFFFFLFPFPADQSN